MQFVVNERVYIMAMTPEKKLMEILSGMDKQKIAQSKQSIEQLLNSPQGKKLSQQIGNIDRNKIVNTFMSMNSEEIKKKLQNIDISQLSKINADDVIDKLK